MIYLLLSLLLLKSLQKSIIDNPLYHAITSFVCSYMFCIALDLYLQSIFIIEAIKQKGAQIIKKQANL